MARRRDQPVELTERHDALLDALRERSAGRRDRRAPWRKVVRRAVTVALSFTVLLGVGSAGAAVYEYEHLNSNIKRVDVLQKHDVSIRNASEQLNAANFLIIGSDSRAGDMAQYGSDVAGQRSDTTMLIHLSPDRTRAIGISIPRDSWVDIPSCTGPSGKPLPEHMGMFNSAITDGGPACTIATVQKLTGIAVTHYVDVDFDGFKAMVNALGTVTVCSPEAVHDKLSGLALLKGNNQLNGDEALAYVRARETLGDGSDLGRIKRQQRFLGAVMRQALSGSLLTNPIKLTSFLEAATKAITLDTSTSFGDLQSLTSSLHGLDPANVVFYTAPIKNPNYTPPGTTMTGRVLLDPVLGRVLYDDVINDASLTVNTKISVSASLTTTTTLTPPTPTVSGLAGGGVCVPDAVDICVPDAVEHDDAAGWHQRIRRQLHPLVGLHSQQAHAVVVSQHRCDPAAAASMRAKRLAFGWQLDRREGALLPVDPRGVTGHGERQDRPVGRQLVARRAQPGDDVIERLDQGRVAVAPGCDQLGSGARHPRPGFV